MAAAEAALTIRKNFQRVGKELLYPFQEFSTGNVCDTQNRTGALDYRIKPVSRVSQFCGSALTVDAGPRDNLAPWAALEIVQPGDVLVIFTGGYLDRSVIGDVYAGMEKNAGAGALVTA